MFTVPIQVRYYETDMMEIAHHTNHIRWFEFARVEFFRHYGVSLWEMMDEDIVFPILSISCQYFAPARFDDVILIETTLEHMSKAQMTFSYRLVRESDGELVATGQSKNAFSNRHTGRIIRLKDKYYLPLQAALEEIK